MQFIPHRKLKSQNAKCKIKEVVPLLSCESKKGGLHTFKFLALSFKF